MKVSVIVPVYNRQDVILRSVQSLLSQEFDEPYEILVVDDGSSDGTAETVEGLSPIVRVIRQKNAGAAAARRKGIEQSRGEYVAFLDSDDVAEPWHLTSHYDSLREASAVLSWARIADMNGDPFSDERQPFVNEDHILQDPLEQLLRVGCFTVSMNLMTTRQIGLEVTEGRDFLRAANDYDFTLRVANKGMFVFTDRITIRCDRRDDGISRTMRSLQAAYAVVATVDAVRVSIRRRELKDALHFRIEKLWPTAFVELIQKKQFRLALKVLMYGLRHGWSVRSPKYLWWSWDHTYKQHNVIHSKSESCPNK